VHYFPITLPFLLILGFFLVFLIVFVEVGILRYAYHRIGIGQRHMFLLLLLSFFGSYINIPVWELLPHAVESPGIISFGGMTYVIPLVANAPGTIVAVNVGGAVIPVCLSIYLFLKNRLFGRGLLGIVVVTIGVHLVAHPVKGVGIALPVLFPPILAAAVGLLLSRRYAPPLAYMSGSLGTLIGADLLNLDKIQALGAPVASIGGAGTFDGIFLTGILSVLLAGIFTRDRNR
jgi:uncharacterized membrane protein